MLSSLWSKKRFGNRSMHSMDWISARCRNAFIPPGYLGQWHLRASMRDVRRLVVHTHKLADSALSRYFGLQEGENFCQLVIGNAKWSDPSLSLLGSRKRRNGSAATNKKDEIEILKWTQKMQRFPLVNLLREAWKDISPSTFPFLSFEYTVKKKIMNNKQKLTQLDSLTRWKRIPNHHLHKQYVLNDAVHTEFQ